MRYALKYDVRPSLRMLADEIDLSQILHPLICEGATDLITYDWNIPSFYSHGDYYLFLDNLRSDQWRWEFLRRNILYRLMWCFRESNRFDLAFRSFEGDRDVFFAKLVFKLFGLRNFPDPRISSIAFIKLEKINPPSFPMFLDNNPNNEPRFSDFDFEELVFTQIEEIIKHQKLNKGTVFIAIDPHGDIQKQIKKIGSYFSPDLDQEANMRAKARREDEVQRKTRSMWLLYLKVLDARDSYASWSKIAQLLPAKEVASRKHAARDTWDAADRIRRNFASVI
ncbi:hypothetical protein ASE66_09225 [Bosea sp. Root483D1]|uniref:hypothetical protein n=1 Tax=Bosea sp. Root483D1 TaxID=1736544 RepID=UPI00071122C5|nr:hypothetical protein [Bosea sp. Root483D1]KRE16784.1 hypothetical protein ASE66_09225 [Bosea sp. Root483D1]